MARLRLRGGALEAAATPQTAATRSAYAPKKSRQLAKMTRDTSEMRSAAGAGGGGRERTRGQDGEADDGVKEDLDAEIEQLISNQDMLEVEGGGRQVEGWEVKGKERRDRVVSRLPRPNTMEVFREISGSAIHFYDWPSANNPHFHSTDEDRVWRSDRHIIYMDKTAPIFNPEGMVDFDESDTFHTREYWDQRYNASFNISTHGTTMEVSADGKTAGVRMESGDPITDHIIRHCYNGLHMDQRVSLYIYTLACLYVC